jgi:glycosyltransferase involved in cell wall biosynthesis
MSDVLLVISGLWTDSTAATAADRAPRKDYVALAETLQATILDRSDVAQSAAARLLARCCGTPAAQAWLAFRHRRKYRAIVTDGEHVGIPLALLLKFARAATPHVTIGHRITAKKKRAFFRRLRTHTHITRMALHSGLQFELAVSELGIPAERLALVPYQADPDFWRPQPVAEERLIVSAGLEFRDYPTLFRAVEGLDARVVVGAASYWSRRRNSAASAALPPNVSVGSFDYLALRDLYARASVVVVPLEDVDFQAGITTILEAMAMGKAVVVTHSRGQTDVVEDRRAVTRGSPPRPRPPGMLRRVASDAGVEVEPNGMYVSPGDAEALRRAIVYLLDNPSERARLGAAGRRAVERFLTVDQFAHRMRELVQQACGRSAEAVAAGPSSDLSTRAA